MIWIRLKDAETTKPKTHSILKFFCFLKQVRCYTNSENGCLDLRGWEIKSKAWHEIAFLCQKLEWSIISNSYLDLMKVNPKSDIVSAILLLALLKTTLVNEIPHLKPLSWTKKFHYSEKADHSNLSPFKLKARHLQRKGQMP